MKKFGVLCFFLFAFCSFLLSPPAYAASASLSLDPASGSYAQGEIFEIKVLLNTGGGRTSGSDVLLNFDSNLLQAQDIIPGDIYSFYVGEEIDNDQGKLAISGLAGSTDELYQGDGVFATIEFQGKNSGSTQVTFDFTSGYRNDSNVADFDAQADILASASGGSYQIEAGVGGDLTPTPTPTSTTALTATPEPTPTTEVPVTAVVSLTSLMTISGVLLISLGAFLFSLF